jgi:hypothetical protein
MDPPDDLQEYLRGGSALSRQYKNESAPVPPNALDRRVLKCSREAQGRSSRDPQDCSRGSPGDSSPVAQSKSARAASLHLAPLAFAASVLLSVALVLAIVFGPQTAKRVDDAPRLLRVAAHPDALQNTVLGRNPAFARKPQLYSSDPLHARPPQVWLADIAALRRAGRNSEADAEYRRFRNTYPDYSVGESVGELATRP